jgi:hypothetical protein
MQILSTFFPKHPKPRTVVHAGPLLMKRTGGVGALRRYLRIPRRREVFLIHQGQTRLREVARAAGVTDIALDSAAKQDANAATEMALALGARRLDFTIDEPALTRPSGGALRELSLNEAERLARNPEVRPRIRAKLRAGCAALRHGISRVRIGDPPALAKDEATTLVVDPTVTFGARENRPREGTGQEARARAASSQPPLAPLALPRHTRRRHPPSERPATAAA